MSLGSGIRDPRSGIRKKPIPDPDPQHWLNGSQIRIQNYSGSERNMYGSATLLFPITCSTPKRRSCLSFSETAGRSVSVPGRLHPFRLPRFPPFSTIPMTKSSPISCTRWVTHIYIGYAPQTIVFEANQLSWLIQIRKIFSNPKFFKPDLNFFTSTKIWF